MVFSLSLSLFMLAHESRQGRAIGQGRAGRAGTGVVTGQGRAGRKVGGRKGGGLGPRGLGV